MSEGNNKIAYALYMQTNWRYGINKRETLIETGIIKTPEEFELSMKGNIFCPVCTTPLSRSPENTAVQRNSRIAHFKHIPSYSNVPCRLKTPKKEGFFYKTEEEARTAIENNELAIISGWMKHPPNIEANANEDTDLHNFTIEDLAGEETDVPIKRHTGEQFKLPSVLSSVTALCKNFPQNLLKGFYFPNGKYPLLLSDALFHVGRITTETSDDSRLYFGKIIDYRGLTYRNVIEVEHHTLGRFKMYTYPKFDARKHINITSIGRYILFHSYHGWESSIPYCYLNEWGQYSLLPEKYESYLLKYCSP